MVWWWFSITRHFDHCTGIVTVFEVAPPMAITMGTAAPFEDAAGTSASTWYSPTEPGARPENRTVAGAPPMVTVGVAVVCESWLPLGGW